LEASMIRARMFVHDADGLALFIDGAAAGFIGCVASSCRSRYGLRAARVGSLTAIGSRRERHDVEKGGLAQRRDGARPRCPWLVAPVRAAGAS
jgi:hypothetical protein